MEDLKFDIREWNDWIKERFKNKDFITIDELLTDHENLIFEVERLEEEIKDLQNNIEDNYRQITPSSMYGISDKDFY